MNTINPAIMKLMRDCHLDLYPKANETLVEYLNNVQVPNWDSNTWQCYLSSEIEDIWDELALETKSILAIQAIHKLDGAMKEKG